MASNKLHEIVSVLYGKYLNTLLKVFEYLYKSN